MEAINIIELKNDYLKQAEKLANKVFSDEDSLPSKELRASTSELAFNKYKSRYDNDIKELSYFVAIDNKKVVGLIGLYSTDCDFQDTSWIGWYCVDPKQRGKGIGKNLLDFAINKAKSEGKKYLSLYTSTDESERASQIVYEKYAFYITHTQKESGYDLLFRKKTL